MTKLLFGVTFLLNFFYHSPSFCFSSYESLCLSFFSVSSSTVGLLSDWVRSFDDSNGYDDDDDNDDHDVVDASPKNKDAKEEVGKKVGGRGAHSHTHSLAHPLTNSHTHSHAREVSQNERLAGEREKKNSAFFSRLSRPRISVSASNGKKMSSLIFRQKKICRRRKTK